MRNRHPAGFTLVETIFSTLFISVAVLAIVNLFPGAYLSIRKSEATIQADIIAKSIIDEMRLTKSFEELREGEEFHPKPSLPFFEAQTIDGTDYKPKVEVLQTPAGVGFQKDRIKHVKVTIAYRLGISEKSVVHETYFHSLTKAR